MEGNGKKVNYMSKSRVEGNISLYAFRFQDVGLVWADGADIPGISQLPK
jgi:hypothetical protein